MARVNKDYESSELTIDSFPTLMKGEREREIIEKEKRMEKEREKHRERERRIEEPKNGRIERRAKDLLMEQVSIFSFGECLRERGRENLKERGSESDPIHEREREREREWEREWQKRAIFFFLLLSSGSHFKWWQFKRGREREKEERGRECQKGRRRERWISILCVR